MKKFLIPLLAAAIAFLLVMASNAENLPRFALPIKCTLGQDCFVMLYTDRDPSLGEVDFGCGRMTYNGHTGTDFAIPDEQVMAQGVPVQAAADGKVLRIRDGVQDRKSSGFDDPRVKGKECGNGAVIDHGQGWQTQYCHLRQNSLAVKPGEEVKTGTMLGLVGQSGAATFPHVHFEPSYKGKPVDPFLGLNAANGCKVPGKTMWQQNLSPKLTYVPTGLMNAGFTDHPPSMEEAEKGSIKSSKLAANSSALIFWVRAYGVLKDDVESLRIIAPDRTLFTNSEKTLERPSRQWFSYTGRKKKSDSSQDASRRAFSSGNWRGEYKLTRNGKVIVDISRSVQVN